MTSNEILEQARSLWIQGRSGYRESMTAVGHLLHEFLLARLEEGDLLPEGKRLQAQATRAAAVQDAARKLGISRNRVLKLLGVAATVRLLAPQGQVKSLSLTALKSFMVCVERPGRADGLLRRGPQSPGRKPSDLERWRVKPRLEGKAQSLFAEADREAWTDAQVSGALNHLLGKPMRNKTPQRRYEKSARAPTVDPLALARAGTPQDVADYVMTLVSASSDPDAVTRALEERLRRNGRLKPRLSWT